MNYSGNAYRIPTHRAGPSDSRELKRYHTVRYYAHRVHESLSTRVSKLICTIFLGLLFIVGIITFILWLSLRPHRPRVHIHQFSITGLEFEGARITFGSAVRNANQNIGIRYDTVDAAVYYRDQKIGFTPSVSPAFNQEPKSTQAVAGTFTGSTLSANSQQWAEITNDRKAGSVAFRLELTATIRFRVSSWESKRHRMHANCDVNVGQDGMILDDSKARRCPVYFS